MDLLCSVSIAFVINGQRNFLPSSAFVTFKFFFLYYTIIACTFIFKRLVGCKYFLNDRVSPKIWLNSPCSRERQQTSSYTERSSTQVRIVHGYVYLANISEELGTIFELVILINFVISTSAYERNFFALDLCRCVSWEGVCCGDALPSESCAELYSIIKFAIRTPLGL